jgi:ABC-type polysaccharide/polyol phosphate export permease
MARLKRLSTYANVIGILSIIVIAAMAYGTPYSWGAYTFWIMLVALVCMVICMVISVVCTVFKSAGL